MTPAGADPYRRFRLVVVALALLTVAATAAELAAERHWNGFIQRLPWVALVVTVVALALVVVRPTVATVWLARVLAAVVFAFALLGIWEHVDENHNAGPLDFRYATTWESLSSADQWWKAASKAVGPAPPLAPGVLAQAALLVLAATAWHPATRR